MFAVFVENARNQAIEETVYRATKFFFERELPEVDNVVLTIRFESINVLNSNGVASVEDRNENEYLIEIAKERRFCYTLETLFHELTHLKQFHEKRLEMDVEYFEIPEVPDDAAYFPELDPIDCVYWEGKPHPYNFRKWPLNSEQYNALPWEVEANTQMEILYEEFGEYTRKDGRTDRIQEHTYGASRG
jgi:hypothetical protein